MFVTWQPVLTDHQAFTYQSLSQVAGVPVVAYVTNMEDGVRKAQGWADTQVSSVERRLIPQHGFLLYCYGQMREQRKAVHIFASPFQQPRLILVMFLAAWLGVEFYLISEPYSPNDDGYFSNTTKLHGKFKAALRPLLYRAYSTLLQRRVAGIFTISPLALAQYQQAGVPPTKLFPFGYFIPSATTQLPQEESSAVEPNLDLNIIFVGSLIQRKGVDLLQKSVQRLAAQGYKISVNIYGPGDASLLKLGGASIRYLGMIPFGHAQSVIAPYDLLVLPSRYDGWGVVVNEALCAGVPVVCSDTTGAGAVAVAFGAGLTFSAGSVSSLCDVLLRLIAEPLMLKALRTATAKAAQALQPDVAARYMFDVIQASAALRPTIRQPWYPESA